MLRAATSLGLRLHTQAPLLGLRNMSGYFSSLLRSLFSSSAAGGKTKGSALDCGCGERTAGFPGAAACYTEQMTFLKGHEPLPVYRVLDLEGNAVNKEDNPNFSKEECIDIYKRMSFLHTLDTILYDSQRQGRISFYMTNFGEEACQIGSAMVLEREDEVYAQYRETGVLLTKGFPLDLLMAQAFSTVKDLGKGRQMPVHYGSKELHFQTISSPLGTQIPQAVGAAYALKLAKKPNLCICYFGEGAASEGDFHAAMNFAATLQTPTIFFCRNNGYAISTPAHEQYKGDGIVARGFGYGMRSIRVDGNDILAVYNVTKKAREICVREGAPVLIEAMTYRAGHHSTSDDASRYRSKEEEEHWKKTSNNPIIRFGLYLRKKGWWNDELQKEMDKQDKKTVLKALQKAQNDPKPGWESLFDDVYDKIPSNLREQKEKLREHIAKYPDVYPSN